MSCAVSCCLGCDGFIGRVETSEAQTTVSVTLKSSTGRRKSWAELEEKYESGETLTLKAVHIVRTLIYKHAVMCSLLRFIFTSACYVWLESLTASERDESLFLLHLPWCICLSLYAGREGTDQVSCILIAEWHKDSRLPLSAACLTDSASD